MKCAKIKNISKEQNKKKRNILNCAKLSYISNYYKLKRIIFFAYSLS